MKKTAILTILIITLFTGLASAKITASISPNPAPAIELNSTNNWQFTEEYSGAGSTSTQGAIKSYAWSYGSSQSGSGTTTQFTFTLSSLQSPTVDLVVSNGTHSASTSVDPTLQDTPRVAITSGPTSVTKGETVTYTSSVNDTFNTGTLSYKWKVSGSQVGTSQTLSYSFSSTGDKTLTLKATDGQGYSNTDSITVSVSSNTSNNDGGSTGGGGFGGGNFGGTTNTTNKTQNKVNKGKPNKTKNKTQKGKKPDIVKNASFKKGKISKVIQKTNGANVSIELNLEDPSETHPVQQIKINTPATGSIEVNVTDLGREKPKNVANLSTPVYNYQEINTNLNDTEVINASIKFQVNKTWIQENNATVDTVVMNHYNGTAWNEIPTKHLNSTNKTEVFQAEADSFSYFAVAVKETQTTEEQPKQKDKGFPTTIIGALVVLLGLAAAAYYLYTQNQ